MRSLRLPSLLVAILCTAFLAGPAAADHHEAGEAMAETATETAAVQQDTWNQDDAAKTAKKFSEEVDTIFNLARIENYDNTRTLPVRGHLVVEDLRVLRRHARSLSHRLASGQSMADTRPLFERMEMILGSLRVNARRTPLLADRQPEIDQARETLDQLRAYYGIAPPDVASPPSE